MINLSKKILDQREIILEESIQRNFNVNSKVRVSNADENLQTKLQNTFNEDNLRNKNKIQAQKGEKNKFKNANLIINFEVIKTMEFCKKDSSLSHEKPCNLKYKGNTGSSYNIFKTEFVMKLNSKIRNKSRQ